MADGVAFGATVGVPGDSVRAVAAGLVAELPVQPARIAAAATSVRARIGPLGCIASSS
jgi:hypothetical protein